MGIWKRDIRKQVQIDAKELTKTLTQMEKKKLIKKIGSGNTMKVRYILFDTEPDRSITGGAFYEGDRFDKDLVEVSIGEFYIFTVQSSFTQGQNIVENLVSDSQNQLSCTFSW